MRNKHRAPLTLSARMVIIILLAGFLLLAIGYGYVLSGLHLFHR